MFLTTTQKRNNMNCIGQLNNSVLKLNGLHWVKVSIKVWHVVGDTYVPRSWKDLQHYLSLCDDDVKFIFYVEAYKKSRPYRALIPLNVGAIKSLNAQNKFPSFLTKKFVELIESNRGGYD